MRLVDPADAALLRLMTLDELARVFPSEDDNAPICKQQELGFGCTRAPGHNGPHVAHGSRTEAFHAWPRKRIKGGIRWQHASSMPR